MATRRPIGRDRVLSIMRSTAEKKYHDTIIKKDGTDGSAQAYVTSESLPISVCDISQGYSDVERVGDKLTITSLEIRHVCFPNLDIKQWEPYTYRITVFIWRDDTVPGLNDIYQNANFTGTTISLTTIWPYTHDAKVKRKILYDKSFTAIAELTGVGNIANSEGGCQQLNVVIPMTKIKERLNTVNYQIGTTTGVNKVYVALTSNVSSTIVPGVALPFRHFMSVRVNFVDM